MAKDPAFLFYPNDYIGGTMGMTFQEKGAYMELLMLQFNRGHMTKHMIGQVVGQLWDTIQVKFVQDKDGLWYNARLDEEQQKRKKYTESRRNNIKGLNQYSKGEKNKGHVGGHMTYHMENENENENINKKVSKFKKPEVPEITDYFFLKIQDMELSTTEAERFFDFYESKGWMVGKNKMKNWKSAVNNWLRRNKKSNNDEFSEESVRARMDEW
jgi:uncharacterized protein YdaU (DUF1376 family)